MTLADRIHAHLTACFDAVPFTVEELAHAMRARQAEVEAALAELERDGRAVQVDDGWRWSEPRKPKQREMFA